MFIRSRFVIAPLAVCSMFLAGCEPEVTTSANVASPNRPSNIGHLLCQPDFSLGLSPTAATISSGQSVRVTISLTSLCGFTGTVDVGIKNIAPSPTGTNGFTIHQSRYDIPLSADGSAGAYIDFGAATATLKTTYVLTIAGKASSGCCHGLSYDTTFTLTVT